MEYVAMCQIARKLEDLGQCEQGVEDIEPWSLLAVRRTGSAVRFPGRDKVLLDGERMDELATSIKAPDLDAITELATRLDPIASLHALIRRHLRIIESAKIDHCSRNDLPTLC